MRSFFPVNAEEKEFCRHISDLVRMGGRTYYARFSTFLTEREQLLAETTAAGAKAEYCFWGGHSTASRKMFASPATDEDDFPIKALTFLFREKDQLSHRDFLGTFMSMGIKRDQIGDIAVTQGVAAAFFTETAADLILSELEKVGGVGVSIQQGLAITWPEQQFEQCDIIVSSFRTDAVIAALCGLSREKSASLIKQGNVVINGIPCSSVSENIDVGDVFSVKGFGKFILSQAGGITKKGKNHIIVNKYK